VHLLRRGGQAVTPAGGTLLAMNTGLFVSATALGFAYAALPGAVNAEALRRGVAGGFWRSFLVHLGALAGAGFWATLALTGASLLAKYDEVTTALALIGAAFMIRLTIEALRSARSAPPAAIPRAKNGTDFAAGLLVGIANPAGLPFWTGMASEVAGSNGGELTDRRAGIFVAGVLAGSLAWGGGFSALVSWGRRWLTPGFFRAVNLVCAIAFGFFALRLLWSIIHRWLI
jgi:chemosensory pili system protein ChpE